MSLHLPSRRVLGTTPTILKSLQPTISFPSRHATQLQQLQQRRNYKLSDFMPGFLRRRQQKDIHQNSPLGDLNDPKVRKALKEKQDAASQKAGRQLTESLGKVRLEGDSMFGDEIKAAQKQQKPAADTSAIGGQQSGDTEIGISMLKEHLQPVVDPDPLSRVRWQRKAVIQHVTRCLDPAGKETRAERIRRTERAHDSRSTWMGTSTKKLVHLAHQIQGKTVEDAIVQMQFSKKKWAREIRYQLLKARDEAVVEKGMGLGKHNGEAFNAGEVKKIQDKSGKWIEVKDPTQMYVSEAWVGRGPVRAIKPIYHARGRISRGLRRQAAITIRVKEHKTIMREDEERKTRAYNRGPWIHLPDRPVTAQRQYYSW